MLQDINDVVTRRTRLITREDASVTRDENDCQHPRSLLSPWAVSWRQLAERACHRARLGKTQRVSAGKGVPRGQASVS